MKKSIYSEQFNILLDLLKNIRKKNDLTQKDLAKKLNKPQSFVSKYEIGERRLDIIELRSICKILNINFIDFIKKLERKLNETK